VNYQLFLLFRPSASINLPNKYICCEEYFKKFDELNSMAQLISTANCSTNSLVWLKILLATEDCGLCY